jgi:hypothetical protein
MCFSAGASFGAGAVLTVIGVGSIRKVHSSSQLFFASIPLIFAIQQVSEGFLWLALQNPKFAPLQQITTYLFLFFAQVLWPVWVPYAIMKLETNKRRRKIGRIFVGIGAIVSVSLAFCLLNFPPEAKIVGRHILYVQGIARPFIRYGCILYAVATIVPPFFSSIRRMWILGLLILVSYVISAIFYMDYIVSVWCFFASIISISIYAIIYGMKKSDDSIFNSDLEEVSKISVVP